MTSSPVRDLGETEVADGTKEPMDGARGSITLAE